jgi:hypothetical protein
MDGMRRIREEPPEELRRAVAQLRRVAVVLPVLVVLVLVLLGM